MTMHCMSSTADGHGHCSLTECPLLIAISFRLLNTKGTVSGLGLNSVFWLFLEFYGSVSWAACIARASRQTIATSPRSPSFLSSALITERLLPVDSPMALMSRLSPMPSSTPT